MKTTKGQLRNITSGILHTNIGDVYTFFEKYVGAEGIMTHHLPSAVRAIKPILENKLSDEWFIDKWIKEGLDENIELSDLTDDEKKQFWESFEKFNSSMWDSIKDKTIIVGVK